MASCEGDCEEPCRKAHRVEGGDAMPSEPSSTSVLVRGLATEPLADPETVRVAFTAFGVVRNVTVLSKDRLRGKAFVDFESCGSAEAAAKAGRVKIGDLLADVELKRAQPPPADGPNRKARRAAAFEAAKLGHGEMGAHSSAEVGDGGVASASAPSATRAAPTSTAAPSTHNAGAGAPEWTVYVRGAKVEGIFDVFAFFREYGVEGKAAGCVKVEKSRRPYFLVDWTANEGLFRAAVALDGRAYKGEPVAVKPSSGETVAAYLAKQPGAIASVSYALKERMKAAATEARIAQAELEIPAATLAFMPRALRGRGRGGGV